MLPNLGRIQASDASVSRKPRSIVGLVRLGVVGCDRFAEYLAEAAGDARGFGVACFRDFDGDD